MAAQSYAQKIRDYSRQSFVEPARRAGTATFEIIAGDVHQSLHLSNQLANVCQTLRGRQFLKDNDVVLERVEGPPSGQGTRAKFVYRFADAAESAPLASPLYALRGIAKDVFRSLGGAEEFIRQQRATFDRTEPQG